MVSKISACFLNYTDDSADFYTSLNLFTSDFVMFPHFPKKITCS